MAEWHAKHDRKEGEPEPVDPDPFMPLQEALYEVHANIRRAVQLFEEAEYERVVHMLELALNIVAEVWRDLIKDQLPMSDEEDPE
jgi:chloramphenicol 3-O-phosphotransferase